MRSEVSDFTVYFVIAYYVESYQGIVSVSSTDMKKLADIGAELTFDIMAP